MKTFIKKTHHLQVFLIITLATLSSSFIILDQNVRNPFFSKLEYELDEYKIDIVQDWHSNVSTRGRPVLAPLANYNARDVAQNQEWITAFRNYSANAIVAVKSDIGISARNFLNVWNATPREQRVFISFAREDLEHAEKIADALENQGYHVFLYTRRDREIFSSPQMISNCMRTAGIRLIIDSDNARRSLAVQAEAAAANRYTFRSEEEFREQISEEQVKRQNDSLEQKIQEAIQNLHFSDSAMEDIIRNTIQFYKEREHKILSRDDILTEFTNQNINGFLSPDSIALAKQNMFNNLKLDIYSADPYEYNRSLMSSLGKIANDSFIDLSQYGKDEFRNSYLKYFKICPFYEIPKPTCPRCSQLTN